jgi:Flp pilus assembly protein TadD
MLPRDPMKRVSALRQQLLNQPNNAQIIYALGSAYLAANQIGLATNLICQAISIQQNDPDMHVAFGSALFQSGRYLEAVCAYRKALSLNDDLSAAYNGLGNALQKIGERDLGISALKCATKRSPSIAKYWSDLAASLSKYDSKNAYEAAKTAHALDPNLQTAYIWLAESLLGMKRFMAAENWIRKGLRRWPKWGNGYNNLGRVLQAAGDFEAAKNAFLKAISLNPNHADPHIGLSNCFMATGDFERGWEEYEWRFKVNGWLTSTAAGFVRKLTEPMWNDGKTLLVYGEQGIGDTIQMIRYIHELRKRNCNVILMIYRETFDLLRTLPSASVVITYGDLIPRYDYHTPLFSLPKHFGTTIETVPQQVPYIPVPNKGKLPAVITRPTGFRVGFIWSTKRLGAVDYRNVPLNLLSMIFKHKSITFFSFQVNEHADELDVKAYPNVHSLKPFIKDWRDTAWFISKMDLIISIDSGLTHVAGALGKNVWVLLPHVAEWRWLFSNKGDAWYDKSPWYPTARLFRASSFTSWNSAIRKMDVELGKIVDAKRSNDG